MFREASGAPGGHQAAPGVPKWSYAGVFGSHVGSILRSLFRLFDPLVPFVRVGFAKKEIWRGFQNGDENESENGAGNGAILVSILAPFRDLIANLPLL